MITAAEIKDRIQHYLIYIGLTAGALILLLGVTQLWTFFFGSRNTQTNKPKVIGAALPGSTVSIDQANTQIDLSERPWEVGIGVGALRYDQKDGYIVGLTLKRKF